MAMKSNLCLPIKPTEVLYASVDTSARLPQTLHPLEATHPGQRFRESESRAVTALRRRLDGTRPGHQSPCGDKNSSSTVKAVHVLKSRFRLHQSFHISANRVSMSSCYFARHSCLKSTVILRRALVPALLERR
ncbi:hypothetical protein PAAG_12389 [Paracoccidioides lutzii Pb01]|uniref:Uncharacterized protein n=1 Tax=Paracoccidioides lutzii (strain ATCC MYA-826 / Pb01) TaxID=502779 RepID=A0A0A2VJ28_PARBA|nr:hypothetical protein PAAG_12389 [Paracoccidioides lutzii Pb01]KGQ00919.1 hypothetical protein PAAG_12389 [Paracoccidioides lutzii Pb01]